MKSVTIFLNILTIFHIVFSFFDIVKVNNFYQKPIHIFHLYQNVTKQMFRLNLCKPQTFHIFYVDKVDNSVDNSDFASFSTFLDVDNFFAIFESSAIFFSTKNSIVQCDDFVFFIHIFYPHRVCGKCGYLWIVGIKKELAPFDTSSCKIFLENTSYCKNLSVVCRRCKFNTCFCCTCMNDCVVTNINTNMTRVTNDIAWLCIA